MRNKLLASILDLLGLRFLEIFEFFNVILRSKRTLVLIFEGEDAMRMLVCRIFSSEELGDLFQLGK